MTKSAEAFRTISEVADDLGIPKHVLRFWEVKFTQIRPMKRGGGRRYYRPADLELLRGIRHLLHREGYTIKGVQKILREQGVDVVKQHAEPEGAGKPPSDEALVRPEDASGLRGVAKRPSRADAGAKAGEGAAPQSKDVGRILEAAIAELEACRAILKGQPVAAQVRPEPQSRRGGAR